MLFAGAVAGRPPLVQGRVFGSRFGFGVPYFFRVCWSVMRGVSFLVLFLVAGLFFVIPVTSFFWAPLQILILQHPKSRTRSGLFLI